MLFRSISGDGASQLSSAVLANNKIEKFNDIPIKEMRADSLTTLELPEKNIGVVGGLIVAGLMPVMGSLTEVDVRYNNISGNAASQLSAVVLANTKIEKFNEIPIKEMRADSLTELNLSLKGIGIEGSMVVAGLMPLMASLTSVDLSWIELGPAGVKALVDGGAFTASLMSVDLSRNRLGPAEIGRAHV